MEENIICNCMEVSEHEITDAIRNKKAIRLQDIEDITGAMLGCGSCTEKIEELLERER